jgi:hypothetical protein
VGKTCTTQENVLSLAAGDIEEAHKHDTATKHDALPILIALARLMDHHNPNTEDFTRLGKKHEGANRIGEDWQTGRYASAKNKLQDAMRKAALDDIHRELLRCDQAAEEAAKANEDPSNRVALETKVKKLIPGTTPWGHYTAVVRNTSLTVRK